MQQYKTRVGFILLKLDIQKSDPRIHMFFKRGKDCIENKNPARAWIENGSDPFCTVLCLPERRICSL
jgi:hypothetical protein